MDDYIDEMDNDLIILSGFGLTSHWNFPPNTTTCPVENCQLSFKLRSTAIYHFKQQHATNSVFCLICNRPICSKPISIHYREAHPEVEIPERQQIDECTQKEVGIN